MEEWKPIIGYDYYEISNLGRIRSLPKKVWGGKVFYIRKGSLLKPSTDSNGYKFQVMVDEHGIIKYNSIHRLVAKTFIPNLEDKLEVNHKNGIKDDNRVENLEWVTKSENLLHSYRLLNRSCYMTGNLGKNCRRSKIILQYDMNNNILNKWYGSLEISRKLGFYPTCIVACCNGRQKTAYGYKRKYL